MVERPRFLADVMLGKLAKWLRLLGYDTLYSTNADDMDLVRVALAQGRILLTRDVELTHRRGVNTLLIRNELIREQLREVLRLLDLGASVELNEPGAFSRCVVCNQVLRKVDRISVENRVPPYVYQTLTQFTECPECGRVYWRGSHWARIVAEIEDTTWPDFDEIEQVF
jgi:uncharacterized protein with PIN domain